MQWVPTVLRKVQPAAYGLSNPVERQLKSAPGDVVIDSAAKTTPGHFSVSVTDDSGEPEAITTGNFLAGR